VCELDRGIDRCGITFGDDVEMGGAFLYDINLVVVMMLFGPGRSIFGEDCF